MASYKQHEHLKDAIDYDLGKSDTVLTKLSDSDFY